MHLQCYGLTADYGGRTNREFRLVEGVVQRHLHYIDDPMHKTPAIELSAPIPKGMSGAPAFFAQGNDVVFGLAIGSKQSAIVDYEYEHVLKNGHENHVLRERIAEYGLVADMFEVKEWLIDMHREHD